MLQRRMTPGPISGAWLTSYRMLSKTTSIDSLTRRIGTPERQRFGGPMVLVRTAQRLIHSYVHQIIYTAARAAPLAHGRTFTHQTALCTGAHSQETPALA